MTCFRLNDGQTLLKYCKDNNINYSRVYIRIGRGLSIEQALAEACERRGKRSENNLKYMLGGKSVHSQLTPAEYTRFKRYLHVRGFSVEKSFNLAKKARRNRTE